MGECVSLLNLRRGFAVFGAPQREGAHRPFALDAREPRLERELQAEVEAERDERGGVAPRARMQQLVCRGLHRARVSERDSESESESESEGESASESERASESESESESKSESESE